MAPRFHWPHFDEVYLGLSHSVRLDGPEERDAQVELVSLDVPLDVRLLLHFDLNLFAKCRER